MGFFGVCGIVKPSYNYGNWVRGLKICTICYSWLCKEQKVSLLVKPTVALFTAFGHVPFSSDIFSVKENLSSRMLRSDISLIIQLSWCNSNIACIIQKKNHWNMKTAECITFTFQYVPLNFWKGNGLLYYCFMNFIRTILSICWAN